MGNRHQGTIIFGTIAFWAIVLAAMMLRIPLQLLWQGEVADAVVTRVASTGWREDWTDEKRKYVQGFVATITYRTGLEERSFERAWSKGGRRAWSWSPEEVRHGQRLKVRYLPDDPGVIRIDRFIDMYGDALFPLLLGGLFAAVAVAMWRSAQAVR